jgi:hypothetical protein
MKRFDSAGIKYFNPVVKDWTPACAEAEAQHLASDRALLFAITDETEGVGSLAETGWAARSAGKNQQNIFFVIQDYHEPGKPVDPKNPSNRARALVRAHAKKAGVPVYSDLEAALDAAVNVMLN